MKLQSKFICFTENYNSFRRNLTVLIHEPNFTTFSSSIKTKIFFQDMIESNNKEKRNDYVAMSILKEHRLTNLADFKIQILSQQGNVGEQTKLQSWMQPRPRNCQHQHKESSLLFTPHTQASSSHIIHISNKKRRMTYLGQYTNATYDGYFNSEVVFHQGLFSLVK